MVGKYLAELWLNSRNQCQHERADKGFETQENPWICAAHFKISDFKQSLNGRIDLYLYLYFYWAGFTVAQRERAQEDFNVPYEGAPPHPPHICIRKTATAPGSPYSFRIVRGFFYVPQNYQHSRNCETGPPAYRPYPRRLESLTICRWNYKGSTFLLSYLKTLSVGPVGVTNSYSKYKYIYICAKGKR